MGWRTAFGLYNQGRILTENGVTWLVISPTESATGCKTLGALTPINTDLVAYEARKASQAAEQEWQTKHLRTLLTNETKV